ncbi:uncharacterized protein METZ01_LOCUS466940 [marine metagenome]|uniref:Uncharacterized protein n=1 Tax=marine metagenome TaxID=408172 RepID=A0A383B1M4_9ZZZZ
MLLEILFLPEEVENRTTKTAAVRRKS